MESGLRKSKAPNRLLRQIAWIKQEEVTHGPQLVYFRFCLFLSLLVFDFCLFFVVFAPLIGWATSVPPEHCEFKLFFFFYNFRIDVCRLTDWGFPDGSDGKKSAMQETWV